MRFLRAILVTAPLLASCTRAYDAQRELDAIVQETRAAEGEQVLKQAFVLQEAYRADHGRYAATFAELEAAGWETPPGLEFHHPPRIVRARAEAMCIVIEPRRPNLWAQHVDESGRVRRGPCP